MSQEQLNQENDFNNEFSSSETYLATFEAAIQQLQKIMENPQSGQKMTINQSQQQLQILSEKYEKIEKLFFMEQEQIEELINTHVNLQKELNNEYSLHQNTIFQGKREILQLTLANKQALQIQNDGQRTLEQNQQEAERIFQYVQKLQKDIYDLNVIIQGKQKEENNIDDENIKYQNSIDEFRKDQNDQKEGLEEKKLKIIQGEKSIKLVRKEQFDMQKKIETVKKTAQEIKNKTASYIHEHEVALSELRNEKRTLLSNEKKLEEIEQGLGQLQTQVDLSNQHLEQIRELNKNMKNKVQQVENAVMIYQSEGPESEELKALENLLAEYNQLLNEKQKVYQNKEQEKGLLTEHLQQMNNFAQQYLEKQQLSQQNENQISNFTNKLELASDIIHSGDNIHNINDNNNSQTFGMECIQSQYEQEQDSQMTQNHKVNSQNLSKQTSSPSQNYQIYLDQTPQQSSNSGKSYNVSELVQQQNNLKQQGSHQQQQEQQNHHQQQFYQQSQPDSQQVQNQQHQLYQNQLSQQQQQLKQQQSQNFVNQPQSVHIETHSDKAQQQQQHDNKEGHQKSGQNVQTVENVINNQSFGNPISNINQQIPQQVQHKNQMNSHLDTQQQKISQEQSKGQAQITSGKLQESIQQQGKNEQQQNTQKASESNNTVTDPHKQNLTQENQKTMIKMGIPGAGSVGYKNILEQLKNNTENE